VDEGFQHGFLEHIFCILPIPRDPVDPAQDLAGVSIAEFAERTTVSGLCGRNQPFIA
jgi:hypothetical protein